ncbi:MAG: Uma2 family endonuclease [Anaerolinea sp.]
MAAPTKTMTLAEYLALPETTQPTELLEGVLLQMPAPTDRHQAVVIALLRWLLQTVTDGTLRTAPTDVAIQPQSVVQPDLFWIAPDSACVLVDDRYWQGAPDLVIEVISEAEPHPPTPFSERRRGQKSPLYRRGDLGVRRKYELYQRAGVREYWLVNPDERSVEVFTLEAGRFARHGIFFAGDRMTSPALGLQVDAAIFFPSGG